MEPFQVVWIDVSKQGTQQMLLVWKQKSTYQQGMYIFLKILHPLVTHSHWTEWVKWSPFNLNVKKGGLFHVVCSNFGWVPSYVKFLNFSTKKPKEILQTRPHFLQENPKPAVQWNEIIFLEECKSKLKKKKTEKESTAVTKLFFNILSWLIHSLLMHGRRKCCIKQD